MFLVAAFEAFIAVLIKVGVFWDGKECALLNSSDVSEELTQSIFRL